MNDRSPNDLAETVRRRTSAEPLHVSDRAQLPLVHPISQSGPVQAQAEQEQAPGAAPGRDQADARAEPAPEQPSPEQVADRVYELLLQDLRIERERLGR